MLKMILLLLFLNLQTIWALSKTEVCSMELQTGKCAGRESEQWYYNKKKNTCESFVYSGCGGNANRFATRKTCYGACGDYCKDPSFNRKCITRTYKVYFNPRSVSCQIYRFGGCGIQNSFWTFKECRTVCQNECTLPPEAGNCRGMVRRYFYNSVTGICEMFIYSGCGGNANNFEEQVHCEARCHKSFPSRFI